MKMFVTGGCGQIGSHVIELLLARGDSVLAIDNLATGWPEHLAEHRNLEVVIDAIADRSLVPDLFARFKPDVVVQTAASYKDPPYRVSPVRNLGGFFKCSPFELGVATFGRRATGWRREPLLLRTDVILSELVENRLRHLRSQTKNGLRLCRVQLMPERSCDPSRDSCTPRCHTEN